LLRHRNPKEHDVTDQATAPTASFLTQDAFDRLTSELAHLTGEGRTEIAKRIEATTPPRRSRARWRPGSAS
jgi:hypothetical protein